MPTAEHKHSWANQRKKERDEVRREEARIE
jgi:hypothetical protein